MLSKCSCSHTCKLQVTTLYYICVDSPTCSFKYSHIPPKTVHTCTVSIKVMCGCVCAFAHIWRCECGHMSVHIQVFTHVQFPDVVKCESNCTGWHTFKFWALSYVGTWTQIDTWEQLHVGEYVRFDTCASSEYVSISSHLCIFIHKLWVLSHDLRHIRLHMHI